jgi:hypothetical protein
MMTGDKLLTAAAGAGTGVTAFDVINGFSTPYIGAPLTVIAMAMFGAWFSHGYFDKEKELKKLYFMITVNTFLGSIGSALLPAILDWDWFRPALQGPLAGGLAFMAQATVPPLLTLIPEVLRKLFRLDKKEDK